MFRSKNRRLFRESVSKKNVEKIYFGAHVPLEQKN